MSATFSAFNASILYNNYKQLFLLPQRSVAKVFDFRYLKELLKLAQPAITYS